jgi:hypothetical protein
LQERERAKLPAIAGEEVTEGIYIPPHRIVHLDLKVPSFFYNKKVKHPYEKKTHQKSHVSKSYSQALLVHKKN